MNKEQELVTLRQELAGTTAMITQIEQKLIKEYETMPLSEVRAFKEDLKRHERNKNNLIRKIDKRL